MQLQVLTSHPEPGATGPPPCWGLPCPWSACKAEECQWPVRPVPTRGCVAPTTGLQQGTLDQICQGTDGENGPGTLPKIRRAGGDQELAFLTSSQVRPCCWPAGRAWGTTVPLRVQASPHELQPRTAGEEATQCRKEGKEGRGHRKAKRSSNARNSICCVTSDPARSS